jgi:hypothetical protein
MPLHRPELGQLIEFRIHDRDVIRRWRLKEGIVAQTPPPVEPLDVAEEAGRSTTRTPPGVSARAGLE